MHQSGGLSHHFPLTAQSMGGQNLWRQLIEATLIGEAVYDVRIKRLHETTPSDMERFVQGGGLFTAKQQSFLPPLR